MRIKVKTTFRTVSDLLKKDSLVGIEDPQNRLEISEAKRLTFERNPVLKDGAKAQIIGTVDGKVMGRLNVFMYGVKADEKVYEALGGDSLWVDDLYRKTLYALDLVEMHNNLSADHLSLNTGISHDAQNLFKMSGNKMFPILKFALVKHCSELLETRLPAWLRRIVGPILDVGFFFKRIQMSLAVRRKTRNWRFEPVDTADEAAMRQVSESILQDPHRFAVHASPAWLKWIVENDFDAHREKVLYRCWDGKCLIGYVLARTPGNGRGRGKIKEWQLTPEHADREPWLLMAAAKHLIGKCDYVIVSFSPDSRETAETVRRFLLRLPDQYVTLGLGDDCPLARHRGYDDSRNWRIRPAIGDVSFY